MSQLSGEPSRPVGASHPTGDPGRVADPTESGHRSSSEDADTLRPQRPQRPHGEPAPEASRGVAEDIAWLYRHDGSASGVTSGGHQTLLLPLDSRPSHPSGYQQVPAPPLPPPPRSRNPVIIMIVLLLCLTAGAVAGLAFVLLSDWRITAPGSGASSAEKAAPPGAQQVTSLTPTQVNVDCQAPQSTDGAGDVVVYVPEQMSDGRMNTAWRCNGNGVGQVVTFGFPAGTTIAEVGLVNGYAKVDPGIGAQRYGEYRRITTGDLDICQWHFVPAVTERRRGNRAEVEHPGPVRRPGHNDHRCQYRAWIDGQGSRCRLDLRGRLWRKLAR